ncbi:acyl carrier protein [Saccharopolyspora shandongensis]|uniref:Act minimal PKS acyl carrier protein n=1 Tax=Saccharopolyspora shandongensis TaxID=418495 RepID=A0A1H2R370_9PSEU|nr:acyl carrier protein [Saccharopolyspora shandongensis]SDW13324.1 act minimal PKS acyl carrier protein [Saccharopolyspora shandongensis]
MSNLITLDDLRRILAGCAGAAEDVDLGGDILDLTFADLGYDSLALMETAAVIGREFGVVIPDDELGGLETPRAMLDRVAAV